MQRALSFRNVDFSRELNSDFRGVPEKKGFTIPQRTDRFRE